MSGRFAVDDGDRLTSGRQWVAVGNSAFGPYKCAKCGDCFVFSRLNTVVGEAQNARHGSWTQLEVAGTTRLIYSGQVSSMVDTVAVRQPVAAS